MKTFVILLFCVILFGNAIAQFKGAGIYEENEKKIHLLHRFPSDGGKIRIRLGKSISVHQDGKSTQFSYDKIYGYRLCDSTSYRIVNQSQYQILNVQQIHLYECERIQNKSSEPERSFYFSHTATSPILPQPLQRLIQSYPDQHELQDLIARNFKTDEDLIRFNSSVHQYELIHLLEDFKKSMINK